MRRYVVGPTKSISSSTAATLLWDQGTIPSGSQVRGVTFVMSGTAFDIDSLTSMRMMKGGTDFIKLLELQWTALMDAPGKKATASTLAYFTLEISQLGFPFAKPNVACPDNEALSMEVVVDGTPTGGGTIYPIFHIDNMAPADYSPMYVTSALGPTGALSNQTFAVTTPGLLTGFVIDTTNLSSLVFNYAGTDIWRFPDSTALIAVQNLWGGTTVTTNRLLQLDQPIPVIPGQTNLIVSSSSDVGQVVPLILQPQPK